MAKKLIKDTTEKKQKGKTYASFLPEIQFKHVHTQVGKTELLLHQKKKEIFKMLVQVLWEKTRIFT